MATHIEQIEALKALLETLPVLNSTDPVKSNVYIGARKITDLNKRTMPAAIIEIGDNFTDPSKSQVLDRVSNFPVIIGLCVYETGLEDQIIESGGILDVYEKVRNLLLNSPNISNTCDQFNFTNIKHEFNAGDAFDIRAIYLTLNLITWYKRPFSS